MSDTNFYYDPINKNIVSMTYYVIKNGYHMYIYSDKKEWHLIPGICMKVPPHLVRIETDEHLELLKSYA